MTTEPEPIRRSDLPPIPPPEWEFFAWFPHSDGGGDMVRGQRQRGVQVCRRVSYGDWEPVRPGRWADELEPETRATADTPAQPQHCALLARLEAEQAYYAEAATRTRIDECVISHSSKAHAFKIAAAHVLAVFEGPEAAAAYMRGEASGCAEGEVTSGDLPTDEDFLVALEGALEKRLLPKPGIGVLEDVRGAVMQALGPLVDQLRAEAERQVDAKVGVAGEWGNALADKTAAEATLRAVREYVETSDDDAIRTRETVLRILGDRAA